MRARRSSAAPIGCPSRRPPLPHRRPSFENSRSETVSAVVAFSLSLGIAVLMSLCILVGVTLLQGCAAQELSIYVSVNA